MQVDSAIVGSSFRHCPWEKVAIGIAAFACIIATIVFPWVRIDLGWRYILTSQPISIATQSYKILAQPWLAITVGTVCLICLIGLLFKNRAGEIAVVSSLLLLACFLFYLISLANKAYNALGLYTRILATIRGIPIIGQVLESVIKDRLDIRSFPGVGLFVFIAADLIILMAGVLLIRRKGGPRRRLNP